MDKSIKKILILDDEKNIRQSLVDYFEDHEWVTIESDSSEQALGILDKEIADAAIVDIRLPGTDGNDFIRKAIIVNPKMVFVICTGSPEYIIPEDLLKSGCVSGEILRKPVVDMTKMEKAIKELIKNSID